MQFSDAIDNILLRLVREPIEIRDERAREFLVNAIGKGRMHGRLPQLVNIRLSWLGTLGVTWPVKHRFCKHVGGFGVRTFQYIHAADISLVKLDRISREYALSARVIDEITIVV